MPASTNAAGKGSARRPAREALDRWLAEADALLGGDTQAAVAPAVPAA